MQVPSLRGLTQASQVLNAEARPLQNARTELAGVQILRGLAAFAVVFHHASGTLMGLHGPNGAEWIMIAGAAGVDIFFVISGLIMYHTTFGDGRRPISPSKFLAKRITRIYPLYWVCLLGMLALKLGGLLKTYELTIGGLIESIFLMPSGRLLLGVAWTLVYEMLFYLIFAALLPFRSALVSALGCAIGIVSLLLLAPLIPDPTFSSFFSHPVMLEFVLGLGLGWLLHRKGSALPGGKMRPSLVAAAVILILLASAYAPERNGGELVGFSRLLFWGLPAAVIVAAMLTFQRKPGRLAAGAIALGAASYALYLTHPFIILVYGRALKINVIGNLPQTPIIAGVCASCIAVAFITHYLLEQRLLWLGNVLVRHVK
jgi:exopolysaccharide production protein ExoZ